MSIDIVLVQVRGLNSMDDRIILEWAAQHNRIVLTHDLRTMPAFAYERVACQAAKNAGHDCHEAGYSYWHSN